MTPALLVSAVVFALLLFIAWLDYRRICRRDTAPVHHTGKPRLP